MPIPNKPSDPPSNPCTQCSSRIDTLESEVRALKDLVFYLYKSHIPQNSHLSQSPTQSSLSTTPVPPPYPFPPPSAPTQNPSNPLPKNHRNENGDFSNKDSSELLEMEASEVLLPEVPEESSNVASEIYQEACQETYQENSHPNSYMSLERSKSPLMEQIEQKQMQINQSRSIKSDGKGHNSSKNEDVTEEEKAEFYFSCHERMRNDGANRESKDSHQENIFTNSFYEENMKALRETQSMPNLSKTTLNEEIEYELANYKLNESSNADIEDLSPNNEEEAQNTSRFSSIKKYKKMDEEIRPKFITKLNSARKNLNRSDEFEAQDIINSINHHESKQEDSELKESSIEKALFQPFEYGRSYPDLKKCSTSPKKKPKSASSQKNPFEYTFGKKNLKLSIGKPTTHYKNAPPAPLPLGDEACDSESTIVFNTSGDQKHPSRNQDYYKMSDSWNNTST
ncbi:unnamed protein product [Moneuplotes crassus]|uniref:Uncharacterized protein n=2 Tax=Euplotes crassus TaxID=5936 RepID=A0AAD1XK36_EUPCR|nr:unnamed protein product [Moneuplotes crassus]